jgi:hypothetical protein
MENRLPDLVQREVIKDMMPIVIKHPQVVALFQITLKCFP